MRRGDQRQSSRHTCAWQLVPALRGGFATRRAVTATSTTPIGNTSEPWAFLSAALASWGGGERK
jgi:hypothetical protein